MRSMNRLPIPVLPQIFDGPPPKNIFNILAHLVIDGQRGPKQTICYQRADNVYEAISGASERLERSGYVVEGFQAVAVKHERPPLSAYSRRRRNPPRLQ